MDFYYNLPEYDAELLANEKMQLSLEMAKTSLNISKKELSNLSNFNMENIKKTLIDLLTQHNLKPGQLLWPIRVALSGKTFSPGAFETVWVLGKEETLKRIEIALKKLS